VTARSAENLVRAARAAGVVDAQVLEALQLTPRAEFVPVKHAATAYRDEPVAIGHSQVTTQPSLSAMMIESLSLSGEEYVLELGTGLGFQTALLARLAARVVSVERWPDLVEQAGRSLARVGLENVWCFTSVTAASAYPSTPLMTPSSSQPPSQKCRDR
jgi:protein-L-isoaspartate(D-aspartate) O-methyltransferase